MKRIDRLGRDIYEGLWIEKELKKRNVCLIPIEQNVEGLPEEMLKAFRNMVWVFADLERGMTVRKLKEHREIKFNEGGPAIGQPAFGFMYVGPVGDKQIAENPDEQKTINTIRRLRRKNWGYHKIASALNGESMVFGEDVSAPTRRGGKWHAQQVKNAISSNHIQGYVSYNGKRKRYEKVKDEQD